MEFTGITRKLVRRFAQSEARFFIWVSRGRITANHITWLALILHLPIAAAIFTEQFLLAGVMLIVFGLLDAVDGEVARLQKADSEYGMFLDASTDRIKESLLYMPIIYIFADSGQPFASLVAAITLAGALIVSYIKAKGEVAAGPASRKLPNDLNRMFQSGFAKLEVRIALLALGLITGQLLTAVAAVAILAWGTAFFRLFSIGAQLKS